MHDLYFLLERNLEKAFSIGEFSFHLDPTLPLLVISSVTFNQVKASFGAIQFLLEHRQSDTEIERVFCYQLVPLKNT